MDLEQLTKHQTLLLTLLVSFVTSIATGIVTVSLMDQAPEGVTRVINQIVERTVETVVPANQGAAVATEKTVVVKQDELVPQSIATVQKSVIRIVTKGGTGPITRGVVVDTNGLAAVDSTALNAANPRDLEAILYSGERVPFEVVNDNSSSGITFINLELSTSTGFAPAMLVNPSKLTLGQTVLRIGGAGSDTVAEGVIAALPGVQGEQHSTIEASVTSATPGSVLLTIFGEVIGVATPSLSPANDTYTVIVLPETL
ncbi:MAG: hypothetical protein Q8P58_01755 [Candidatus Adlerbacteria bacterium]|nr:hypothetical protein [Candidatus Adlerbacteria bacterium]MDZ4226144.1 hypothetical protein [Patescibacteria group bacterium]